MVMESRFGLSVADVILGKDRDLSEEDAASLKRMVARLGQAEPVQYVLGEARFCGHTFAVSPAALIPRPETEGLVRAAMALPRGSAILDIGTGSGCIAVSLALAGYAVSAMDVSAQALDLARENAERLGAGVELIHDSILSPAAVAPHRRWQALVSNPPYVCRSEAGAMHPNVLRHEPHLALFVPDDDPLVFYRAIAGFGQAHLQPGGQIFLEINRRFGPELVSLFTGAGYIHARVEADQYGQPRYLFCTLPS